MLALLTTLIAASGLATAPAPAAAPVSRSIARTRPMRHFVSCMLLMVVAACGSDSPTQPRASVVGTWNLQTIDGSALPYLVAQTDSEALELMSDVLTFDANGTFTQLSQIRVTQDGQASTESFSDGGSYALNGTAVTFTFDGDGSIGTASLAVNTLSLASAGFALVYKKQ